MNLKLITRVVLTIALWLPLAGCYADLPILSRDISTEFDLTSPTEYMSGSGIARYYVNPTGISIKRTSARSDGSVEIILGGVAVENGIPNALHEIQSNQSTDVNRAVQTDYPIDGIASASDFILQSSSNPFASTTVLRPLENCIALGGVSQNPRYTAVTITGMVKNKDNVDIREQNESLRLLTQYYIKIYNLHSAHFNPSQSPMLKEIVHYLDPNYFSEGGRTPVKLIYRGSEDGKQPGGLNVLIWDGAKNKRATYSISYDGGKTFSRVIIDWNNVVFRDTDLADVVWSNTLSNTVNDDPSNGYLSILLASGSASATLNEWAGRDASGEDMINKYSPQPKDGVLYPPPDSCAEGLSPSFKPLNSTNKEFFFCDSAAPIPASFADEAALNAFMASTVRSTKYDKFDFATVEIADRIRVYAKPGKAVGTSQTGIVQICVRIGNPKDIANVHILPLQLTVHVNPRP